MLIAEVKLNTLNCELTVEPFAVWYVRALLHTENGDIGFRSSNMRCSDGVRLYADVVQQLYLSDCSL